MNSAEWDDHTIVLGDYSYPFRVGRDCLNRILSELRHYNADLFIVVSDDTVLALHGDKLLSGLGRLAPVVLCSAPAGERMKSHTDLHRHIQTAIEAGASRRSVLVAFGGGVPGNLGGIIAALLFRGIRLVHLPTTMVAAMDAVISLKQAINSPFGKNHVGTFHPPSAVYVDLEYLSTLPGKELRSGLCEVAKNCLAIRPQALPRLHELLAKGDLTAPAALQWLMQESIAAKMAVMIHDPKEQAQGLILEYGHTVGHAIEFCDGQGRGADGLSHGEAVALGMLVAANVSRRLGALDRGAARAHDEVITALGVEKRLPAGICVPELMRVIRRDNKRGYLPLTNHESAMVLLRKLGEPMGPPRLPVVAVSLDVIEDAIAQLAKPRQAGTPAALAVRHC